jgi:hypothetical protein
MKRAVEMVSGAIYIPSSINIGSITITITRRHELVIRWELYSVGPRHGTITRFCKHGNEPYVLIQTLMGVYLHTYRHYNDRIHFNLNK